MIFHSTPFSLWLCLYWCFTLLIAHDFWIFCSIFSFIPLYVSFGRLHQHIFKLIGSFKLIVQSPGKPEHQRHSISLFFIIFFDYLFEFQSLSTFLICSHCHSVFPGRILGVSTIVVSRFVLFVLIEGMSDSYCVAQVGLEFTVFLRLSLNWQP